MSEESQSREALNSQISPTPASAADPAADSLPPEPPLPVDQPAAAENVQSQPDPDPASETGTADRPGAGPLNLARIRELRKTQQKTATKSPGRKPREESQGGQPGAEAPAAAKDSSQSASEAGQQPQPVGGQAPAAPGRSSSFKKKPKESEEVGVIKTPERSAKPKVVVPSRRDPLAPDLENELNAALGGSDLDSMLIGDSMLQVGHSLNEGQRLQGRVVKTQGEYVFVSLGGPNEGMVPAVQFTELPEAGAQIEVVVRGYSNEEGLYECTLPGNAVEVSDWSDISEGEVIEVLITGANSGGLECKVGSIRGFIPASQVAEYRIENLGEMVDQKVLCVVTEANERRRNLVLSRRAVLEREKQEKRAERLASIAVGDAVEGKVSKIMDFGAFVDIGGLDGLLHISQLSWERVGHPSEILEEGQRIQVRIEKIDQQSGKISLSYRSLQEHPWSNIEQRFPVGSTVKGTVTRLAEFGAFVKIATGVEGLVHLSELAHHRVSRVSSVVAEGQEVEVKILSVDEPSQRISLSIKAAQPAPEMADAAKDEEAQEPPRKPVLPKHAGPLKGGTGRDTGGEQFGLKW